MPPSRLRSGFVAAKARSAALTGASEVALPVFASTMTTVLVFIPVAFVEQEAGQLYSDVAVAISASILASMLVAITLIPTASARLSFGTEDRSHEQGRTRRAVLAWVDGLIASPARRGATIALTVSRLPSGVRSRPLLRPPASNTTDG